ncbi:hypothetical protein [Egbenema bharatensis]|uniref:hypothetical protein n=1 Tax=Egbenema bharatensis TaxID=3463334 RepID=UPI003A8470C3
MALVSEVSEKPMHPRSFKPSFKGLKRITAALTGTMTIALGVLANPAFAGDPFRVNNPRTIGNQTEAAFKSMFEQGNYVEAAALLQQAESDEPLPMP